MQIHAQAARIDSVQREMRQNQEQLKAKTQMLEDQIMQNNQVCVTLRLGGGGVKGIHSTQAPIMHAQLHTIHRTHTSISTH